MHKHIVHSLYRCMYVLYACTCVYVFNVYFCVIKNCSFQSDRCFFLWLKYALCFHSICRPQLFTKQIFCYICCRCYVQYLLSVCLSVCLEKWGQSLFLVWWKGSTNHVSLYHGKLVIENDIVFSHSPKRPGKS